MTDTRASSPEIEPPRKSVWRNLSVVWLVPVLALFVALGVAWQAYSDRGSLIEIEFENGAGVTEGETTVRYRDVIIGTVEGVRFSDDLQRVIVEARVDSELLPYMDEDATFWVVRPEISTQGVSGLSTVVSGVYIQGTWDSEPGTATRRFEGRDRPVFVLPDEEGRRITLSVPPSIQLQGGAPITFRGIEVGRLEQPQLTSDGLSIRVDAFIEAPHDERLTEATRFWDSSGFSVGFGAEGFTLNVESLASLVTGGLEFDEVYSNAPAAAEDRMFRVYETEEEARASVFDVAPIGAVPVSVQFSRFVPGLVPGVRVLMDDERIGEVSAVTVRSTDIEGGAKQRLVVDLTLDPGRMGFPIGTGAEEIYDFLTEEVENGLRARLTSTGLISSEVVIDFATVYDAPPARFAATAEPYPVMPSEVEDRPDANVTAEGLLQRVADLPLDELMTQTIDTLAAIEGLAGDDELRQVPDEVIALLTEARDLVGGEETQAIPGEARATVAELRGILTDLRESGSVDALTSVLTQADTAMGPISEASAELPELLANLRTLTRTANELELDALVASANGVLASADDFINSEDLAALPASLQASLAELDGLVAQVREAGVAGEASAAAAELRGLLADLRESGSIDTLNSVLTQADAAMGPINTASAQLPELMADLRSLSQTAAELEIEALVTSANAVLETANTLIGSEDMARVPAALTTSLTELEALLVQLREADVAASLNATLSSAQTAAESAQAAADALPALVNRTEAVLNQIGSLAANYGVRSEFMVETMDVLREITTAARSIAQLARTIERNPSSLLTGR